MKKLWFVCLFLLPSLILACPGCAGSMDNPKDKYTAYVLMGFIALTYIPFYIIYSTIIKNRNCNNLEKNLKEK
jgi:hypothetical protein